MDFFSVGLQWNRLDGNGPEAIVNHFIVSIRPMSFSHPIDNFVFTTLIVLLEYNVRYNASVIAFNCAGESEPVYITNIEYGNNKI